jgi:ketosteroid isomerase-like protein
MKRTLWLTISVIALAFSAAAAEPSAAVQKAVAEAGKQWTDAVIKGDRAALEKLLTADLSYTHSSAKSQTKEEFIKDATGGGTEYTSIEFENTKMREYGNTVVVTHNATITSVPSGASHLYITEVWAKEGGHWQMASRQATKIP